MIGPGRRLFNNFDDGTEEGQLLYWDNTTKRFRTPDACEINWDDADKELGIGSCLPNEPLHVQSDFDGNKAIRIQNESLGTAAVARIIVDTSAGSGFFAAYGVNFTPSGSRRPDSCNLVASANMTNGMAIVARAGSGGKIRFYAGGNTDSDLQATIHENGDFEMISVLGAFITNRLTTAQKNALTPVNGMIIYDTDLNKFQGYENGAWSNLI